MSAESAELSPEDKDLQWLREVYRGDSEPQLTWRAVLTGGLIGMVMSLSNLYLSLKIGWAFGVAITASVLSFIFWRGIRVVTAGSVRPIGMLETNCMQSTASAAGYSTGGTVGSAIGALYLVKGVHEPWWIVASFVLLTAALGVFLAIPMKRQMINQEQLPFPDGIAAAETLRSLFSESVEAIRKAWVLVGGMIVGGIVGLSQGFASLRDNLVSGHFLQRAGDFFCKLGLSIPEELHFPAVKLPAAASATKVAGFGFEPSAMMIGAGMIMGLRVCLSMFLGGLLLYLVITPALVGHDIANIGTEGYIKAMWDETTKVIVPRSWGVWAGTAIMVFSSLTGLGLQWRTAARALGFFKKKSATSEADAKLASIEVPNRWLMAGLIPITAGLCVLLWIAWSINPFLALVAVGLSFVLSLVASRATGETNITPMGAMGKVTQLLFAGLAPQNTIINLMSAGTTASAAVSCADLLTDLKSGYLLGANPRRQFLAQFFGIFFGTLVVVPAWYLLAKSPEDLEAKFALVGAKSWKAMADLLSQGVDKLSYGAAPAIYIGAAIGILLPIIEKLFPRSRNFLPSAMGLGLGFIVTISNSFSFLVGAVLAALWAKVNPKQSESFQVPLASGLVAGQGLISVVIALTIAILGLLAVGK